jgi:hypothetical protein
MEPYAEAKNSNGQEQFLAVELLSIVVWVLANALLR